jgi:phospholipid-binding lipoprotein MlaA
MIILIFLVSCTSSKKPGDPYHEFNKDMTEFNLSFDKEALKPAATFYRDGVLGSNDGLHEMVVNFVQNLREPFYCINHILSGDPDLAIGSFFRFIINSSIGFFGLLDPGYEIGLTKKEVSHKDMLKKWGVPTNHYVVLPFLGPSSVRDTIAEPISWFMDPLNYFVKLPITMLRMVLEAIVMRAENSASLDALLNNSVNVYATMKSVYTQKYNP